MPRAKGIKALAFRNLHTDEKLRVAYWKDGVYSRPALAKINYILRDFRSCVVRPMDVRLIDLLTDLQRKLGSSGEIEIISGYRSPQTNARLASASSGVANQSYHMKAMAIDLHLPDVPLKRVRDAALVMQRGGVGYYPESGFVHVDVGPVRRW